MPLESKQAEDFAAAFCTICYHCDVCGLKDVYKREMDLFINVVGVTAILDFPHCKYYEYARSAR
jgi:hypothetical protein